MSKNQLQQERWKASIQNNYGAPEISLVKGAGAQVWDADGKEYLDFLGGIATNILGHAHPVLISAITKQVNELGHVSNLYAHPRAIELAEKLKDLTGSTEAKVFFCNSGAEANEAALKASELDPDVLVQTEIQLKYEGYIEREKEQANKLARLEDLVIPDTVNYDEMKSVSLEAKEKLKKIKPRTIGQASRVSGVSPSDISVLLIYLGR
jgi:hypothetical protein